MRLSDVLGEKPRRVVTLPPTASALQAAALMKEEAVGALLICDHRGQMLGLLSERSLALAIAVHGQNLVRRRVHELMTVGGPTASPADPVREVVRVMTETRARHMPVMQDGAVVGIVSIGDLLKSRLAEKSQENAVLQDLARFRLAS